MKIISTLVLLVPFLSDILALNILVVFHAPVQSHHFLGSSLSKVLANAGHNVTYITSFDKPKLPKNVRIIYLDGFAEMLKKMKEKTNLFESQNWFGPFGGLLFLSHMTTQWADKCFQYPEVQNLLKSDEHFDAVVVDEFVSDSVKLFAHHFKAPLVLYSTIGSCRWVNRFVGNPEPPSYISDFFLGLSPPLSFPERVFNFIFGIVAELHYNYYVLPSHNAVIKKHFPNAPDLKDIVYNVSLVLINSHESISQPVPTVPNMISIGGIHVNPTKQLPKDLQNFMDNAKEGVIYFSMGSNLVPSQMPKTIINTILKVLGSRKEKVLWKWNEDTLENKPANVKISKWLPQQEILSHPNCKLFISHGGWLSTTESISIGTPILALPVFGDQKLNAATIRKLDVGKSVIFTEINEQNLKEAVTEILENPKYAANAKYRSKLFHDRPVKPADLAVYWIEYITRYQGASHLKVAGADLPLYKYLLLDVIGIFLAALIFTIFVIKKLCKCKKPKKNTKSKIE